MLKYINSKKVVLLEENGQETYLPCQNGIKIYRYDEDNLCLYMRSHSPTVIKKLEKFAELFVDSDRKCVYKFKEKDLGKVDKIIKINTKSGKRLRKPPEERNDYAKKCIRCKHNCKQFSFAKVLECRKYEKK